MFAPAIFSLVAIVLAYVVGFKMHRSPALGMVVSVLVAFFWIVIFVSVAVAPGGFYA